jgi:AbrB family looped-hinge helix DNA binding protein
MNGMKQKNKRSDDRKGPALQHRFYGTTVVGERGQMVIPAEARDVLDLKKGDKLLVFGMGNGMLSLSTLSGFERFQTHMAKQIKVIRSVIKNNK